MPAGRYLAGGSALGARHFYVLGGFDLNGRVMRSVFAYDAATDRWTRKADMPTARWDVAAARGPDGLLYALGGNTAGGGGSNMVATNEVYTP